MNNCLVAMSLKVGKSSIIKAANIMIDRIRYAPTITKLLNTAMVDERSLLLKNVKKELTCKLFVTIPFIDL